MWIISFLPTWFFDLMVLAGVVGLLGSYLLVRLAPFIYQYKLPIQIASVALLVVGVWFEGGIANEAEWQARVKEMEAKVAAAEIASQKENVKIVEKVVKKTEYITRRGQDIIQYVDREIVRYDDRFQPGGVCEIPKEFIKAHNQAAEAPK